MGSTVEARIADGVFLIELARRKDGGLAGSAAAGYPRLERAVLAAIGREIEAAAQARLPVVLAGTEQGLPWAPNWAKSRRSSPQRLSSLPGRGNA